MEFFRFLWVKKRIFDCKNYRTYDGKFLNYAKSILFGTINVVETTYGYSITFFPDETVLKKILNG